MKDRVNAILMRFHGMWNREEGQAAVEYGVLVALIIAVSVGVIGILGGDVKGAFQTVVNSLTPGS
jgi:pilus assembly protein Flp/PilA